MARGNNGKEVKRYEHFIQHRGNAHIGEATVTVEVTPSCVKFTWADIANGQTPSRTAIWDPQTTVFIKPNEKSWRGKLPVLKNATLANHIGKFVETNDGNTVWKMDRAPFTGRGLFSQDIPLGDQVALKSVLEELIARPELAGDFSPTALARIHEAVDAFREHPLPAFFIA